MAKIVSNGEVVGEVITEGQYNRRQLFDAIGAGFGKLLSSKKFWIVIAISFGISLVIGLVIFMKADIDIDGPTTVIVNTEVQYEASFSIKTYKNNSIWEIYGENEIGATITMIDNENAKFIATSTGTVQIIVKRGSQQSKPFTITVVAGT